eukprot:5789489-Pyramimonas_sp.AAC.1
MEQQVPFRVEPKLNREEEITFEEVPEEVWAEGWHRVLSTPWTRREAQAALEGRALVLCLKHRLRAARNFNTTHIILNGSMAPVLALLKGRSSLPPLLRICRQACAL